MFDSSRECTIEKHQKIWIQDRLRESNFISTGQSRTEHSRTAVSSQLEEIYRAYYRYLLVMTLTIKKLKSFLRSFEVIKPIRG